MGGIKLKFNKGNCMSLKLIKDSLELLIMQKTQYLKFATESEVENIKLMYGDAFDDYYAPLIEFISNNYHEKLEKAFSRDVNRDFNSIKDWIPVQGKRKDFKILDIGCGIAGVDCVLNSQYKNASFYLLDKTTVDKKIHYGFQKNGAFYNSLPVAKEILEINGVNSDRINLIEVDDPSAVVLPNGMDLVVSIMSWGFHYPVDVYLDKVTKILSDKGVLVIDVRANTNGIELLEGKFEDVFVCGVFGKALRAICSNKK